MRRRYYHSSFSSGARERGRRRGFIHVLLLVFAVLGITMWGTSELFHRHLEQKNTVERESNTALEAARNALFDYAITPPAKVEARALPGIYNAYSHSYVTGGFDDRLVPFRRFSLPCPDVAEDDQNLDGVSDILTTRCVGNDTSPLASGSRFGRLPWRDFNDAAGSVYTYIRGVGDRDYRDGYGQRFWYALSDNVTDVSLPLNPHSLVRITDGWLTARDEDGEVLSDRVAAVVIAPGLAGGEDVAGRIDEEVLYGGEGTAPGVITTYASFHQSYLEGDTYASLTTNAEDFTVRNVSGEIFADQIEYLTIDEIASDSGRGVETLESGEESVYDMIAGTDSFLGVPMLLSEHLQRFGYLPDPAIFDESAVTLRRRSSGIPSQSSISVTVSLYEQVSIVLSINTIPIPPVTTTLSITTTIGYSGVLDEQQGAIVSVSAGGAIVEVALPVAELPPFYLLPGARISLTLDALFAPALPPYNIPLFGLETQLNDRRLDAAAVSALSLADHYPTEGLFGLQSSLFSVDDTNVNAGGFLAPTYPISVNVIDDLPIMLAAPAYAYFQSGNLISLIAYTGGDQTGIENLPPYSAKVLLPTGTRLTLAGFSGLKIRLPARYSSHNATPDPLTVNVWTFNDASDQAVEVIVDDASVGWLAGVYNVPNDWPVVAGDSGFLPVEENIVRVFPADSDARVELSADRYAGKNAISDLSIDMRLYTAATLTITPFPPPGRPVAERVYTTPSTTITLTLTSLPSPVLIPSNSEFSLPAGGRVIYPAGSRFNIGDDFVFPDDSIVRFPDGAVLDVSLPPDAVLSDGYQPGNTVSAQNVRVTLLNGGFVSLRDTRPVIGDTAVFGAQQKIFDIELRGQAAYFRGSTTENLSAGHVFQPFTGRSFAQAVVITLNDGDVLSSNSRVRAKFLTYPRLFYQHVSPGVEPVTGSVTQVNGTVGLPALQGIAAPDIVENLGVTLSMVFDEDTEFFLPPGFALSLDVSTLTVVESSSVAAHEQELVESIRLPVGTGLFDPDYAAELATLSLPVSGLTPAAIQLSRPLDMTLVVPFAVAEASVLLQQAVIRRRLALFPDNDMYVFRAGGSSVEIIPAGSIVDVVDHEAYRPTGVQRVQRVAEDLQVVSDGMMEIFFARSFTMRLDRPEVEIRQSSLGSGHQYFPTLDNTSLTIHSTVVVSYVTYDQFPASGASEEILLTIVSENLAGGSAEERNRVFAPAGTFIRVPAGRPLDFLADAFNRRDARIGNNFLQADYAVLPEGAVVVIPPGGTMTVHALEITPVATMTVTVGIPGPAHLQARGENGGMMALVNDIEGPPTGTGQYEYHGDPLIFLSAPARLVDTTPSDNIVESIYSEIPANARLDLNGRMEIRGDSGFHAGMLPSETAVFLRDFPMLYAVAPECRQAVSPGRECAEGIGEGLVFEMEQGEEYALSESLEAPGGVLLTSNIQGLSLVVEAMTVGAAAHITVNTDAIIINETDGRVSISGGGFVPALHEVLLVRLGVSSHSRAELRTYFGAFSFGDDVSDATYAAVDGELTIHVGGYVGGNYDSAAATAFLNPGAQVAFGAGALLRGGENGEKIFGTNSRAVLELGVGGAQQEVGLADYVILNADKFYASVTLSSESARVDVFGDVYDAEIDREANDIFDAYGGDFRAGSIDELRTARGAIIAHAAAEIDIEPGYLWQGYIPGGAGLAFTENTVIAGQYTLSANEFEGINADLRGGVGVWPNREVQIRMQPTVTALNVWGGGIERPEAIDQFGTYNATITINSPPITVFSTFEYQQLQFGTATITIISGGATLVIVNPAATLATLELTLGVGDLGDHSAGFLSPTINTQMLVDVRSPIDGSFIERVTAVWNPIARVVQYQTDILGRIIPSLPTATVVVTAMIWNRKNNPFPGPVDFAYAMTLNPAEDLWGGRLVVSGLAEEDSYIAINAATPRLTLNANVPFNVPHFQLAGERRQVWNEAVDAYQVAYDWGGGMTLGALTEGVGASGISLRALSRSVYQPVDGYTVRFPAVTLSNPIVHPASVGVGVNSDLMFYLDHTYNNNLLPGQAIRFGNNFNIAGPAAIVPPFGGRDALAVEQVYAERSNLINAIITAAPALHTVYDDLIGNCIGTGDCAAMHNNSSWLPILLGAVAFEGVKVELTHSIADSFPEEVRLVMPQPYTEVLDSNGRVVVIYAGSIIYPRLNTIIPSTPLPRGSYELILPDGPALAAVDVSPVSPLRPRAFYRSQDGFLPSGAFNMPPVTVTTAATTLILNPAGFTGERVIDLANEVSVPNSSVTLDYSYGGGGNDTFIVEDYDGTFVRGILLDDDGTQLITSYYSGANIFQLTQFFSEANRHNELPPRNTDMELGDPLSFRWTHGGVVPSHFVALGAERANPGDCQAFHLFRPVAPCSDGPSGSQLYNSNESGVTVETDGDEFTALRLAHRIEIPRGARMTMRGYSGAVPYPSQITNFFQFPDGSEAVVLNADAGSWVSAHPYVARYQQGLVVTLATTPPQVITVGVGANDGILTMDVSGRRVLHYHMSERNEGLPPLSSVPVYTNVWIRLPYGGLLVNRDTGETTRLYRNALVNPLLGTYLTDRFNVVPGEFKNNYLAGGVVSQSLTLHLVRPALTIPSGARLVAGVRDATRFVNIRNVKAAAIFSLAPLDAVDCPTGDFHIIDGQYPNNPAQQISQIREGVSENRYFVSTGQSLGLAHPCAWIDDPENVDGDRTYLYRGRRRYLNESLQARTISNDRTYLLGGKLEVNV